MTPKSQPLLFFLILLTFLSLFVSAAIGGRDGPKLGGWQPIKNLTDPEVQDVAKFAVTEHNKKANTTLKYQKVVKGETQVVAGVNYRLVLKAKDGDVSGKYEAVVWVKAWEHFKNLTSFRKL